MAKMRVNKIDILSLGKICAAIYAVIGFVLGGMMAFENMSMMGGMGVFGVSTQSFAAIILMPIITAIYGFVLGVIFAFLYNIIASRIGGIEFDAGK